MLESLIKATKKNDAACFVRHVLSVSRPSPNSALFLSDRAAFLHSEVFAGAHDVLRKKHV